MTAGGGCRWSSGTTDAIDDSRDSDDHVVGNDDDEELGSNGTELPFPATAPSVAENPKKAVAASNAPNVSCVAMKGDTIEPPISMKRCSDRTGAFSIGTSTLVVPATWSEKEGIADGVPRALRATGATVAVAAAAVAVGTGTAVGAVTAIGGATTPAGFAKGPEEVLLCK